MSFVTNVGAEIEGLFSVWNKALESGDPDKVVRLYATNAILLPTLSNRPRTSHAEIRDYFAKTFMPRGPSGTIVKAYVRVFADVAICSGIFAFTFRDRSAAQVRKSFVYRWNGEEWLIIEHHSSLMPEQTMPEDVHSRRGA